MHKLLKRQIRKHLGSAENLSGPIETLLEAISRAYEQADDDRRMLERSLDLTSRELLETNAELRRDREQLERRVEERTAELLRLNASLEREITDREVAEEAIRRSEEKYRSLFEDSREVIFITTRDGRLLDMNPGGVELLGYESKDEMLNVDVGRHYDRPEDRSALLRILDEHGFARDIELTLRRKDDRRITVLASLTTERDEAGNITKLRGIARDVTDQRELERKLRQAQKMEAVGRLAGGVAHDFNNLLTAILGYADLLSDELPPDPSVRENVDAIRLAAEQGAEFTRQLLAVGRRQVLSPRLLDFNRVIAEMEPLMRRLIGEDIDLVCEFEPELGTICADPSQIEQVVLNLAVNARDAMPGGGVLRLRTRNEDLSNRARSEELGLPSGAYVLLVVSDTGPGIDESIRDRIFEPFFSTKDPGEGTGLGLSTVYGIVQQSGGHIEIGGVPGRGASFRILLPRAEHGEAIPEPTPPTANSPRGTETVLLVEDEPSVRSLLTRFLRGKGYRVFSAGDGVEALEVAGSMTEPIHLLLTDVVMPRMGGLELAEKLKARRGDLRVLLISGYTDRPEVIRQEQERKPGFFFLQKPFATEVLARKLRAALDGR